MRIVMAALLLGSVAAAAVDDADSGGAGCTSIDACLEAMRAEANRPGRSPGGLTDAEQRIHRSLRGYGDVVVPRLVDLLTDPDLDVASSAAAALRDVKHIDATYLPRIITGLDRDLGWLAPALARIDSADAAREAVDRFLVSDSAPHNQEAYAVSESGERAIPYIIERARCRAKCGTDDHCLLGYALHAMGADAADALQDLLRIAEDDRAATETREGVLSMIAAMGKHGLDGEWRLRALALRDQVVREAAYDALIGIGSQAAGEIFARRMARGPTIVMLRDLAETGRAGMDAGKNLEALLDAGPRELQIGAARTLGFIEYEPAAEALARILDGPSDPVLSWVAAESLGRMRARIAMPALERAAAEHWFLPVRQAAEAALKHIADGSAYVSKFHQDNFALEYFSYQNVGADLPDCDVAFPSSAEQVQPDIRRGSAVPKRVRDLLVDLEKRPPVVALRIHHGWLAGSDMGEWGGQLNFVGDGKAPIEILDENVENIHRIGGRVVAVTGLAHMMMNEGAIFEIQRARNGAWSAKPWVGLPGAPRSSRMLASGDLEVDVHSGGRVLVSPEGRMSAAPCVSK